jgi:mannose-6-phosphate isomerase-like protein (cupin superfamily)
MKASAWNLLKAIPGPATTKWPSGERFTQALTHGTMTVELYAPDGEDPQSPHAQDEVYIIRSGQGTLRIGSDNHPFAAGDCFFVPAGEDHRFESFSNNFTTWVVFWGPAGGE